MEANVQPTELGNLGIGSRPLFSALMLRTMVSHTVMGSHTHSPPWNNSPIQMSQDLSYIFTKQAQQPKMLVGLLFLWSKHCPGTQGMQNIYILWFLQHELFPGQKHPLFSGTGKNAGKWRGRAGVSRDKFHLHPSLTLGQPCMPDTAEREHSSLCSAKRRSKAPSQGLMEKTPAPGGPFLKCLWGVSEPL